MRKIVKKKHFFEWKIEIFRIFYWKNRNFSYYLVKKSKNVIIFDEIYSKKSQFLPFLVVFIVKTRKLYDFDRKIQEFERFLTKKKLFSGYEEAQAEVAKREGELDAGKFEMLEGGGGVASQ